MVCACRRSTTAFAAMAFCLYSSGCNEHGNKEVNREFKKSGVRPYDIPYPSLVAADVDGLLMAGRCISGDFIAHSSYRVTGNAVPMGEAAGLAAAVSLKAGKLPHELSWQQIKSYA